jgi:hypothetical protein
MGGTPRHLPAVGLLATLVAVLIAAAPAAAAGGPHAQRPYHPRAAHIGVVVTKDEVLMSWHGLTGADSGKTMIRRGVGSCPHTPADGDRAGETTPLHVIDTSVQAGVTYCYTLFSVAASGDARVIGTSGMITVPDAATVPPATAPRPAPAPTVTVSRLSKAQERKLAFAGGGLLLALMLLLVMLRSARRMAAGRAMMQPTARQSIVGRNNSALVVPAMIALGWVGVLVAFVVLR